jgi:predicted enzyme involved in methoxymalonyl-ACP biosynthesis
MNTIDLMKALNELELMVYKDGYTSEVVSLGKYISALGFGYEVEGVFCMYDEAMYHGQECEFD